MSEQRDYYFDNIKFFLIILVVLGHGMEIVTGDIINTLYKLIYLFHMPAFVFISGYFFRYQKQQKFSSLVLQYIIFQTLFICWNRLLFHEGMITYSTPYWIMWFLFALMLWKVITPHFVRLKHPIILSIVLAILVGYDNSIGYMLSLSRCIVFFPFFLLGYFASSNHLETVKSKIHPFIVCLLFIGSYYLLRQKSVDIMHIGLFYHSVSYEQMEMSGRWDGLYRLGFLIWGSILAAGFFAVIPTTKMWFSGMGQRTLQVYILHGFIMKLLVFYQVKDYFQIPEYKCLFFLLLICLTIILLSKWIKIGFDSLFLMKFK